MNRNVGGDEIALVEHTFKGVELFAIGNLAGHRARPCVAKALVVTLVLADLAFVGREHGQSVKVIDLDLGDLQTFHFGQYVGPQLRECRVRQQSLTRASGRVEHEAAVAVPHGVGKDTRQIGIGAAFVVDQTAQLVLTVGPDQA